MLRILAALSLLAAMTVAGCSSGGGAATVTLSNNKFDPSSLTVDAGEEVHFEVEEGTHTVTIHKAGDPTTTLLKDEQVSAGADTHFSFPAAGTYHVWCTLHGQMTSGMAMVVTVE
jgi:plastocyanin